MQVVPAVAAAPGGPVGRPVSSASTRPASFAYQPALDGVRGVAVATVLLFHAGFGWMSGGYVGVSVFFTLSGYLITSLALVEHERSGGIDALAFYSRRIRRLMPASLLCLTAVMVAAWLDEFTGVTRLRRDLWAALLQVFNWVTLAAGDSYSEQMSRAAGQRAPLDHYWSLAIEEQFYWVWPLVLVVVLRLTPAGRLLAVGTLGLITVAATAVIAAVWGADATYFATPARLPEILAGAVLAIGAHGGWIVPVIRRSAAALAAAGLGVIAWAAVAWPARGGPAFRGWLPAIALASLALIGGLQVASPLRRAFALGPLVGLGRISYGVYLYHWPVYTLVDERRLGVGRFSLFGVRLAITLAVATLSYDVVELPIRRRRFAWRPTLGVAGAACGVAALVVAFVPDRSGTYTFVAGETRAAAAIPPLADGESLDALAAGAAMGGDGLPNELSRPARVLIVGDSTAFATGDGMIEWAAAHPDVLQVTVTAAVGCGLNVTGVVPDDEYKVVCDRMRGGLPGSVQSLRPDAVVAMVTFRDMEDRLWDPVEGVLTPADSLFRRHLLEGYELLTSELLAAGAGRVVWVIPPKPALPPVGDLAPMLEDDRIDAYRRVVRALPLSFPGQVVVADLAGWLAAQDDPPERHDGLHWSLDGSVRVAEEFLVPTIFAAVLPSTGSVP
jgi:peptidoglycan/LPS O-acetylase OafA/YrhL